MTLLSSETAEFPSLPGGWAEKRLTNHKGQLLRFWYPQSPDACLTDEYCETQSEDYTVDPYWVSVWSATHQLVPLLPQFCQAGQACLELGCGTGLAGMTAALAGMEVTLTDLHPQAVQTALANCKGNQLSAKGMALKWSCELEDALSLYIGSKAFDLILAVDVLYEQQGHRALLATIKRHLHSQGKVLIADPGRPQLKQFLEMAQHDFEMEFYNAEGERREDSVLHHFALVCLRYSER